MRKLLLTLALIFGACAPAAAQVHIDGLGTDNSANSTNKVPVIGCVANTSAPSWTNGFMVPCSVDLSGNMRVVLSGAAALADATANPTETSVGAQVFRFNGLTWDRERGNFDTGALITHTAASAGVTGADQTNYNGRCLKAVVDITAISGTTPTLTVTIQGKDTASGKYYTLLASAALSTVSTTVLSVCPSLTAAANTVANDVLPRTWRVITAIGGTTPSVTATVGASIIN